MVEIIKAEPLEGYTLAIEFSDGARGIVDLRDLVPFEGVFEALRDPTLFAKATINAELGAICWPNGADLDPLVLHSKITRAH